jgi:Tol biopolymer transport system component/DNA-binding winged helix-turn-helix (wHTH) protein
MVSQTPTKTRIRFGLFEADLQSGELWKSGRKVKMQGQPFRVLCVLVQRPGEVVSREELQELLWGKHAAGDFEQSLGTAINKVREALGDSAENPRFVETLARRGYRFIAPVSVFHPARVELSAARIPETVELSADYSLEGHRDDHVQPMATLREATVWPIAQTERRRTKRGRWLLPIMGVVALGLAVWGGYWAGSSRTAAMPRIERLTHTGRIAPGIQAFESLPASVTDGLRIFTSVISGGRPVMAQVDVHTGDVQRLMMPSEISSPMLGDLSPDGASLLLRSHLSPESEQPLWLVPTAGGSAMRLSNLVAHDATWMPDGKAVLYAAGNQLTIHQLGDGSSRLFATLPGRAFWLRWSPDGELLRFTLLNPVDHTVGLWQVGRDGKGAKAILTGWSQPPSECCGSWTGDGKFYVFQANATGSSDLWSLSGKSITSPKRITNGPLLFVAPMTSRLGHRIYFLGLETQSALLEFDSKRKAFVPVPEFMAAANRVEYSRDKQWVIWTDQQGHLWRARADGSERIQVTPDSLEVFLARWSPDGKQIALMAREAGKAWHIFTVAPDGGTPVRLLTETRNEADPSWSNDGQQIVFGRVTDLMGKEDGPRALELLDLKTGKLSIVPGSDGLFSPRWSPDGRYIAAISLDQRKLMLLDLRTQTWRTLAETSVADPVWTLDSKALYFHADQADTEPIYRASIPDGRLEQIANLSSFVGGETADYFFCGLTRDDNPVVRSRTGTGDVYSLNLDGAATEVR